MKITVKQLKQLIKEQVEEQMDEMGMPTSQVKTKLEELLASLGGPSASNRQAILVALNQIMPQGTAQAAGFSEGRKRKSK